MTALLVLGFALVASGAGVRLLSSARWPARRPALGIWAWQTLSASVAVALVLAGVVLALPESPLHDPVAALLRACSLALAEHYATPGGRPVALLAGGLSLALAGRLAVLARRDLRAAAVRRAAQRDVLTLVGRDHPEGFTVFDHATPLVYCLPGRSGTVVVTSAARDALTDHQLELVLAHERKHLRAHHHLALSFSAALSRTFWGVAPFGLAHDRIAALAEMQADDAVAPGADRRDLARALLSLAPASPATGLALASGTHARAAHRVRRLIEPAALPRRGGTALAAGVGLAVLVAPFALAVVPAVEVAVRDCCPAAVIDLPTGPRSAPPERRR
ncbi:M56 family metallopeptidase [Nocardioides hungaricus]